MIGNCKEWFERPPTRILDWGCTNGFRKHVYGEPYTEYDKSITSIWHRPDSGKWLIAQDFVDGCGWYLPETWLLIERQVDGKQNSENQ